MYLLPPGTCDCFPHKTISCLQSIMYLPTSQHNLPYKIKIPTTPTQLFMHPTTYKPKTQTSPQTTKEKQPKTCSPRASLFFFLAYHKLANAKHVTCLCFMFSALFFKNLGYVLTPKPSVTCRALWSW